MIVYRRNIHLKLLLVRTLFLVLAISILKSFQLGWENFAYLFVIVFSFSAFISVTGFSIYHDRIEVLRWYCFGFIPVKWGTGNSKAAGFQTHRMFDEITFEPNSGFFSFILFF